MNEFLELDSKSQFRMMVEATMSIKKILLFIIPVIVLALLGVGVYFAFFKTERKEDKTAIQAPPSVKRVNELALTKRPYVALLPHPNLSRCSGADLIIENLQLNEKLAEYELEYTAGSLIQGVFGRRDLTQAGSFQPLEFGTCSRGKCKCDQDISGGSLTLEFTGGDEDYTLKSDFTLGIIGEIEGDLISTDARLQIEVAKAFARGTPVIVMKGMGLPDEVEGEVVVGPYQIFAPRAISAKGDFKVTLQTQEEGRLMFWNGKLWQDLEVQISENKLTATMPDEGVLVLVKQ